MKKISIAAVLITSVAFFPATFSVAQEVESLRGPNALDAESHAATTKRWEPDHASVARDYVHQPPLIPHSIESYTINLKFNKCLTCHSWANYKKAGAVKISQTHFSDRDGNDLANISARRYFCTQCHVSQVDAPPLVDNTFQPVGAISGK